MSRNVAVPTKKSQPLAPKPSLRPVVLAYPLAYATQRNLSLRRLSAAALAAEAAHLLANFEATQGTMRSGKRETIPSEPADREPSARIRCRRHAPFLNNLALLRSAADPQAQAEARLF